MTTFPFKHANIQKQPKEISDKVQNQNICTQAGKRKRAASPLCRVGKSFYAILWKATVWERRTGGGVDSRGSSVGPHAGLRTLMSVGTLWKEEQWIVFCLTSLFCLKGPETPFNFSCSPSQLSLTRRLFWTLSVRLLSMKQKLPSPNAHYPLTSLKCVRTF